MNRILALVGAILLALTACTPAQVSGVQTLVAVLPEGRLAPPEGPLGGRIAALPTPLPATATPASSLLSFPTPPPTMVGPLATLTAIAGLLPTYDLNATPYAIENRGNPHFIEFKAGW